MNATGIGKSWIVRTLAIGWLACTGAMAETANPAFLVGGPPGGGTTASFATSYWEDGRLVRAGEEVPALGPDLMGDTVNEFSGSLAFTQTDFDLPGNDDLTVGVGRHLATGTRQAALAGGLFGDWDLEIPHLHTLAALTGALTTADWHGMAADGTTLTELRCSQFSAPFIGTGGSAGAVVVIPAWIWWDGYHMYVPGHGDQTLVGRNPYTGFNAATNPALFIDHEQPADGATYPVLTKGHWQLSCLSTITGGAGEGFLARSPDGKRYQFDHMAKRPAVEYNPPPESVDASIVVMGRQEIWMLPSQITDRFGNWVRYTYDTTDPAKVLVIAASAGRSVHFTYVSGTHRIQTATDGTRTWTYAYSTTGALQTVTRPDASTWQFNLQALEKDYIYNRDPGCVPTAPGFPTLDPATYTGTIVHPSGATATFALKDTWHGRSNVRGSKAGCNLSNFLSTYFANYSLISKTLSGPGMSAMTWDYAYSAAVGSWTPCSTGCVSTKTVTITDPQNNVTLNTYGTQFMVDEGLLLQSAEGWNGTTASRTTTLTYASPTAGPYPSQVGYITAFADLASALYMPQNQRVVSQQGVNFTQTATAFDAFARPLGYTDSSTLGYSRVESTSYYDNASLWVLGQVTSHSVGGIQESSVVFNTSTALPGSEFSYGKLRASYTFNLDGTLSTVTDGLGHVTTYSSYMRGLAQHIAHPDTTSMSAVVDNLGHVTSLTNEAATTWTYGYDAMGRLASETPPGGDPVTYNVKHLAFVQVPAAEYGIEPGHWRQTITEGNATTINYLDARWRKRVTITYDALTVAGTQRMKRFDYDPYNRTTFAAYPARSIASVTAATPGTATTYDALGRITRVAADSELGTLVTTTQYLSGFQTQVTDPLGFATTIAYQAFEDPESAQAASIAAPEGQATTIVRDLLAKPLSITRGGLYAGAQISATRSLVYDANQLLCKTVEPETGATIQSVDAANNLAWRAVVPTLTSTATCDTASVPAVNKVTFVYDARDRVTGIGFGDGSQSIGKSYTPDGKPLTVVSTGSTWTYTYNNRRLLTLESLSHGTVRTLSYGYDSNGHRAGLTFPDGAVVTYSPNALGEETAILNYASGVTHQPDGAIAGYTLANGIVHGQTQNVRGLPALNTDSGVLQDAYTYDARGSATGIVDQLLAVTTRTMTYDGLNRLTTANDAGVWGTGTYTYDPLDNIRTSIVGTRNATHTYDTSNRLSRITAGTTATAYLYDSRGNVSAKGSQTFVFDEGNRLTTATGVASYAYDGWGRRSLITFASGALRYQMYDQAGRLVFAWQPQGTTTQTTRYVYLGNEIIAETNSATGTTYLHNDVLGSAVATTSTAGALLTRTRYEAFGATAGGTLPDGPGFTGHVDDPATRLVYMQQRYYDTIAGRFLSVDPAAADGNTGRGFNRYAYVEDDPFNKVDPNGEWAWLVRFTVGAWEAASNAYATYRKVVPLDVRVGILLKDGVEAATRLMSRDTEQASVTQFRGGGGENGGAGASGSWDDPSSAAAQTSSTGGADATRQGLDEAREMLIHAIVESAEEHGSESNPGQRATGSAGSQQRRPGSSGNPPPPPPPKHCTPPTGSHIPPSSC